MGPSLGSIHQKNSMLKAWGVKKEQVKIQDPNSSRTYYISILLFNLKFSLEIVIPNNISEILNQSKGFLRPLEIS